MVTKEQVTQILETIKIPGVMRSPVKLNMIRDIEITDGKVEISLLHTVLIPETMFWLESQINDMVKSIKGVTKVKVIVSEAKPKELNKIKHVVAVMSGKGGVGKSLVTSLVATSLKRKGYEVGILDADITGPSIPKMFGISGRPSYTESGILPLASGSGIEIMSLNLLLPSEDEAVIWRGPIIGKIITQFWEEVLWGDLDYLVVDLPPGTADAPLTVLQSLPVSGIIIVTTPQDLTTMIVKKAVNMAKHMNKPIIGVVENMSYLYVSEIKKKIEIFGKSRGQEIAAVAGAPLLAQLPIDPKLAELCDAGKIEDYRTEDVEKLGKALSEIESIKIK